MKKVIIITGILVALCASSLIAQNKEQSASLIRKFSDASNVRWEKITADVSLARFDESNARSLAYFSQHGDLVASGKQIELNQSPESVQKSLAAFAQSLEKQEGSLRVIHVYELTQQSITKYYINMGNENAFVAVMVTTGGRTTLLKKDKPASRRIEGPVIAAF